MKVKKKIMIYPFDVESAPLIRHSNLINDYTISHIISPNGWGLNNKDVGHADNGEVKGINISNDFDKALENCDTVFFNESSRNIELNQLIYPKLIKAAENSKNIICTIKLEDYILDKVHQICNEKNTVFSYMGNKDIKPISYSNKKIYSITTPVIFVIGLAERTHKFEIQLALRENLKKMGYKISQVGTKNYCELMGFHSFPEFMYSKSFDESEKVTLFNHYIKNIEINEEPDVIVIGVPGGIMPYNNVFTNRFGILAYEVSQAIIPDAVILSTFYDDYKPEFFELISESCKYKLGYNIDCYNIANLRLSVESIATQQSLQYITVDWNFINEKIKRYNTLHTPVYNILDINDVNTMTDFLVNKLEEYGSVQII